MKITRPAHAGTLESSDIFVQVFPAEGVEIDLTSTVELQFGESIRSTIAQVIRELGAAGVRVEARDRGALDCTIRARVETALERAAREEGQP